MYVVDVRYFPLLYKLLKTDLFHRGWTGSAFE